MEFSCHYSANLQTPKTQPNSIPLLLSSYPGRLASRNSTNSSQLNSSSQPLCKDRTENAVSSNTPILVSLPIHCLETGSSIVACLFVSEGICLPSRCLAIDVSSGSMIPAFGRHVTIRVQKLDLLPTSGVREELFLLRWVC
jgi:hypothetical protein